MKIRTDFVTNSSSSGFSEVVIDNPVLLEILARYKEMGAFKETDICIGQFSNDSEPADEYEILTTKELRTSTPTISITLFSDCYSTNNIPHSLNDVMNVIFEVISYFQIINKELFRGMKEELTQRKDEILHAFGNVRCYYREDTYSGYFVYYQYKFDPEEGEYYHEETLAENHFV